MSPPPVPKLPDQSDLRKFPAEPDINPDMLHYDADEQAQQEYVYDAWEAKDVNEKYRLCKLALKTFPFSVDAFNCLGYLYLRTYKDTAKAMQAFENALTCARWLWPSLQNRKKIRWGEVENRPYLRSIHGIAVTFAEMDETAKAIEKYKYLLRVNPSDNQSCRKLLFCAHLELGDYHEAEKISKKYSKGRESHETDFQWGFVLIDYLKHKLGICSEGDLFDTFAKALQCNSFVPQLLLMEEPPDSPTPYISGGSMDEAVSCVKLIHKAWKKTPNAHNWLKEIRFRKGIKPDDDGTILFDLLTKGKILVEMHNGKLKEVTTSVNCMWGTKTEGFKMPRGMKEHDPSKIVCFVTQTGTGTQTYDRDFTSFSYDDVAKIPFWSALQRSKNIGRAKERSCAVCYKSAMNVCSKCKVIYYCSQECQMKDWKGGEFDPPHKVLCKNYIKK